MDYNAVYQTRSTLCLHEDELFLSASIFERNLRAVLDEAMEVFGETEEILVDDELCKSKKSFFTVPDSSSRSKCCSFSKGLDSSIKQEHAAVERTRAFPL